MASIKYNEFDGNYASKCGTRRSKVSGLKRLNDIGTGCPKKRITKGPNWELNPGPPPNQDIKDIRVVKPEGGIMLLDH